MLKLLSCPLVYVRRGSKWARSACGSVGWYVSGEKAEALSNVAGPGGFVTERNWNGCCWLTSVLLCCTHGLTTEERYPNLIGDLEHSGKVASEFFELYRSNCTFVRRWLAVMADCYVPRCAQSVAKVCLWIELCAIVRQHLLWHLTLNSSTVKRRCMLHFILWCVQLEFSLLACSICR